MTGRPYRTALVGFGRIAAGYADDPVMARHFAYASHAQVLADHPDFEWHSVVDPSAEARAAARGRWHVPEVAASVAELPGRGEIEVAVLATPPQTRLDTIAALPGLRAVLIEKPLAPTQAEARALIDTCRERGILVAVNLTRRAEPTLRGLADGGLERRIGATQAAFGIYGKDLRNNGIHLVDMVRMLIGEVESVQAVGGARAGADAAFVLMCAGGTSVMVQPVDFGFYREIGLDIWGERGRLSILHEGLTLIEVGAGPHRYAEDERELVHDRPQLSQTEVGRALYGMYDNLAAVLGDGGSLACSGDEALRTSAVVDAVLRSVAGDGRRVPVELACP